MQGPKPERNLIIFCSYAAWPAELLQHFVSTYIQILVICHLLSLTRVGSSEAVQLFLWPNPTTKVKDCVLSCSGHIWIYSVQRSCFFSASIIAWWWQELPCASNCRATLNPFYLRQWRLLGTSNWPCFVAWCIRKVIELRLGKSHLLFVRSR